LEIAIPYFKKGGRYRVSASCVYQDESFGSFDCTIKDASGEIVASAQMTAFQPEGEVTYESLEAYS
jgi:predicted hotdog family 3-hydroxylacyl-ACP dehydratase